MGCSLWSVDWLMKLEGEEGLDVVFVPLHAQDPVLVSKLKKRGW
jgi:broad-specificity NMP kinase